MIVRTITLALLAMIALAVTASADVTSDCKSYTETDRAIAACTRYLSKPTEGLEDFEDAYRYRGYAYQTKGDYDRAIANFGFYLNLSPSYQRNYISNVLVWRGHAHLLKGENRLAVADFDRAVQQLWASSEASFGRALGLEALGKLDGAVVSYELALERLAIEEVIRSDRLPLPPNAKPDKVKIEATIARLSERIAAERAAQGVSNDAASLLTARLYNGETATAKAELEKYTVDHPLDEQGFFALGAARFVAALEHLGASLYRFGLDPPVSGNLLGGIPFLRFPVPSNPNPEQFTYEKARGVLNTFVADLDIAEKALERVASPDVKLPVNIGLIRLDLDRDGTASNQETLWNLYAFVSSLPISERQAQHFELVFDSGDAAWLRGYSHLLRAMAEFLLAHDWHESFDVGLPIFFPRSKLPYGAVDVLIEQQRSQMEVYWKDFDKCMKEKSYDECSIVVQRPKEIVDPDMALIANVIGFIHMSHWSVVEPERMGKVLHHLEAMVAMSRLSWQRIQAETDDDHEWIPNPSQIGPMPVMQVDERIIAGWLAFLDQFDALLKGKALLPHWRVAKGINLRRVFLEPSTFDPVLWAQGVSALPYLEDGTTVTGDTWNRMTDVFGGNFFGYVIYFN